MRKLSNLDGWTTFSQSKPQSMDINVRVLERSSPRDQVPFKPKKPNQYEFQYFSPMRFDKQQLNYTQEIRSIQNTSRYQKKDEESFKKRIQTPLVMENNNIDFKRVNKLVVDIKKKKPLTDLSMTMPLTIKIINRNNKFKYEIGSNCIVNGILSKQRQRFKHQYNHSLPNQFISQQQMELNQPSQKKINNTVLQQKITEIQRVHKPPTVGNFTDNSGRKITIVTIQNKQLFLKYLMDSRITLNDLEHMKYLFKQKNKGESFKKQSVYIMDSKKLLFLSKQQQKEMYQYLTCNISTFAFQYEDLIQIAHTEHNKFMIRGIINTLYNDNFKVVHQSIPSEKQINLNTQRERENKLFFDSCPNFLYASDQTFVQELLLFFQTRSQQVQQPKEIQPKGIFNKPEKLLTPGEQISAEKKLFQSENLTDENKFSYQRNFNKMKISTNQKQLSPRTTNQISLYTFFDIFQIENPHLFLEILFQCQNIFYNYTRSDLNQIANSFLELFLAVYYVDPSAQSQQQEIKQLGQTKSQSTNQSQIVQRNTYILLIQNQLLVSFNQLIGYSKYLRPSSKGLRSVIFKQINYLLKLRLIMEESNQQSVGISFKKNIIKWRNFIKFHYYFIDFKWQAKEKVRFLEIYIESQNGELDQERLKDIIKLTKSIDQIKSRKFEERVVGVVSKHQFDPLLQYKSVLDIFLFEQLFTMDQIIKELIGFQTFQLF